LQLLSVNAEDRLLDLGCGAGVIAEYISDRTGAAVTGLDYAASAISEARDRTKDKQSRLTFVTGDMNSLDLPQRSFDKIISLDTLYWVADLKETLRQVVQLLKPGGQLGIFMLHGTPDGHTAADTDAAQTSLSEALTSLDMTFDAYDYTLQNAAFWYRNYKAAKDLQEEFEAEGNGFISASLIREGEEEFLPGIENDTLVRFLYHVRL
ncbi:MAG: class I SAM-dependent methyltransferase, partial [Kiloniellales bacterium]|nr:class I SAM-dependent methyltransferase [Kiloniellales bacterium]